MKHTAHCSKCDKDVEIKVSSIIEHSKSNNISAIIVLGCECTTHDPSATSLDSIKLGNDMPNEWKSKTDSSDYDELAEY